MIDKIIYNIELLKSNIEIEGFDKKLYIRQQFLKLFSYLKTESVMIYDHMICVMLTNENDFLRIGCYYSNIDDILKTLEKIKKFLED